MDEVPVTPELQAALAATDQLIAANHGRVLALQEAMAARVDSARMLGEETCKRIKQRLKAAMKGVAAVTRGSAVDIAGKLMGAADALVGAQNETVSGLATRLATAGPPQPRPGVPQEPHVPPPPVRPPPPRPRPHEPFPGMPSPTPPPAQRPFGGIGIPCPPGLTTEQCQQIPGFAPPQAQAPPQAGALAPGGATGGQRVPVPGGFQGFGCTQGVPITWLSHPNAIQPGTCGELGINYQCQGTDGQPAFCVSLLRWVSGQPTLTPCVYGSPNFDVHGTITEQLPSPLGDIDAVYKVASDGFPGFVSVHCPPGTAVPPVPPPPVAPPIPPPPPPVPQPGPAPQPVPPATPPESPPGAICPVPPALCPPAPGKDWACFTGKVPDILRIGSDDFLASVDQLRVDFTNLGRQIVTWVGGLSVDDPLQIPGVTAPAEIPVNTSGGPSSIPSPVPGPLSWVTDLVTLRSAVFEANKGAEGKDIKDKIRQAISCWWSLLASSTACNLAEVILLSVVREFVRILKGFEIGWDLGIWAVKVIELEIPPLEKVLEYLIDNACPAEIPKEGDIIETWLKGAYTDEQARTLLSLRGVDMDVWAAVIYARREMLSPEEFIQWGRRNDVADNVIQDGLRMLGFVDPNDRAAKYGLYDELPTIQDHLLWLQRNVFDNAYVTDFNLLDGFATQAEIQQLPGYGNYQVGPDAPPRNFWDAFGHDLHALGMKQEYAALHYAAHWLMPSPGERQEMVFRLRPDAVPANLVFTEADYLRTLAEQDVAPYFRRRLAEIAYRVYPLRQLNAAVQQGRLDRDAVIAAMQDMGFRLDKATIVADTIITQGRRTAASAAHGFTASVVAKLAPYGLISADDADKYLTPQGFTRDQINELFVVADLELQQKRTASYGQQSLKGYAALVLKAYGEGAATEDEALRALQSAGYPDDAATLELRQEDLKQRWEALKAAIKSVRYAFLHGEIDAAGAAAALAAAGVAGPRIPQYVTQWQLAFTVPRIAATKSEILRFAKEGIISIPVAEVRLANIGVSPSDIQLYVLELTQTIEQARLKAQARAARELRAAQLAAQRVLDQTRNKFCKWYSDAKMIRWYAHRYIEESTFRDRLTFCGRPPEAIQLLFDEAVAARAKVDEANAKAGKAPKAKAPPHLAAGRLQSLYAIRVIDEATLRDKLSQLGYSNDEVQQLFEEAEVKRAKKDATARKSGPTGVEYTGPGHDAS